MKVRPFLNLPRDQKSLSQAMGIEVSKWYLTSEYRESHVTFNTGNRILGAVFVVPTNQSRAVRSDAWMTRTCSA
jgi:hypothetical protein